MTFDDIKAEIAVLVARLGDAPHDRHETEILLHEKLAGLKAFGMPLPQDLVELDALLQEQFQSEAGDRVPPPGNPQSG